MGEKAGFESVLLSDHFHPWIERQGESPFVWSVAGAIAATTSLRLTTGVTCPTVRLHPAIVAQAAATTSLLFGGRFCLESGAARRSTNTSSGTVGRLPHSVGDVGRGRRRHAELCREAWLPTTASTTPWRRPASTRARRATEGLRLRLWPRRGGAGGPHRRWLRQRRSG